jgi:hypothetical protein
MDKHENKHQVNLHNQKIANRSVHCCAEKLYLLEEWNSCLTLTNKKSGLI